jgi:predicted nucleotidyltransferase
MGLANTVWRRYPAGMHTPASKDVPVSIELERGLNEFCGSMSTALGTQLTAVLLYGSVAKGDYVAGKSDVNLLVVLAESSIDALDRLLPVVEQVRLKWPVALMILTESDLDDAADVFSVKFLDIQRHHRVLFGRDVAPEFKVTPERLRRQCSRQLMNLQLRLRQFYLQRGRRPELVESTLTDVLSPFLTTLGVLLELNTSVGLPTQAAAVAVSAAGQLGLDGQLLERLLRLKKGDFKPDAAELKKLYQEFMRAVEKAAVLARQR